MDTAIGSGLRVVVVGGGGDGRVSDLNSPDADQERMTATSTTFTLEALNVDILHIFRRCICSPGAIGLADCNVSKFLIHWK